MAEELPDPIPRELHDAFWGAIGLYRDWGRGQPEPEVSLNQKPVTISLVCDLVMQFEDPMPDELWRLLADTARGSVELDRSYGSGARCLAELIRRRKAEYQRRQETE
jgi:hypothetical protein